MKENMKEHLILWVEVAAGIVIGFIVWSYIAPTISNMSTTPAA